MYYYIGGNSTNVYIELRQGSRMGAFTATCLHSLV